MEGTQFVGMFQPYVDWAFINQTIVLLSESDNFGIIIIIIL